MERKQLLYVAEGSCRGSVCPQPEAPAQHCRVSAGNKMGIQTLLCNLPKRRSEGTTPQFQCAPEEGELSVIKILPWGFPSKNQLLATWIIPLVLNLCWLRNRSRRDAAFTLTSGESLVTLLSVLRVLIWRKKDIYPQLRLKVAFLPQTTIV